MKGQAAFITDSGLGAIVVVDLSAGKARRLLDHDRSTLAEKDFKLQVRVETNCWRKMGSRRKSIRMGSPSTISTAIFTIMR